MDSPRLSTTRNSPDGAYRLRATSGRRRRQRAEHANARQRRRGSAHPAAANQDAACGRQGHARRVPAPRAASVRSIGGSSSDRPRAGYGRTIRLSGRLTTPGANPLASAPVEVYEQVQLAGAPWTHDRKRADVADGPLHVQGAPRARAGWCSSATAERRRSGRGLSTVELLIRGSSSIDVDRRTASSTATTSSSAGMSAAARCRRRASSSSSRSITRRRWRTFAQPRASAAPGRWNYRYRFEAVRGRERFRFRARVRKEAGYPYELGTLTQHQCHSFAVSDRQGPKCRRMFQLTSRSRRPRMLTGIRSRLSFANVTSCLALFIALGGTGYAAMTLPRNSVGSAQLRSKSVGSSELRSERGHLARDPRTVRSARATCRPPPGLRCRASRARGAAGPAGPAGVTLRAAVPSGGTVAAGNATRALPHGRDERVPRRVPAGSDRLHPDGDAGRRAVGPDARATRRGPDHGLVLRRDGAREDLPRRWNGRRAAVQRDRRLLT